MHTQADLRSGAARLALGGVDVLWHLGFQLWRRSGSDMASANLDGTVNVLAARPRHVVFASSAAVYGAWPDNPLPLTESDPARPNAACPYAGQKLEAERRCEEAAPSACLRIGAVLGPNADPLVRRASEGYRRVVPAVRGVRQALQFVHEDDVAAALLAAGLRGATGVFNIAPADWLAAEDVAAVSGGRVLRLPRRVIIGLSEAAFRLHLTPFGADRAVLLSGPLALDAGRATGGLGWRAERSSREVLAAFLSSARPKRDPLWRA